MTQHRLADLAVLLLLAALVVFYCVDAVRASTHVYNLILVLPVSVIVLVLCLVQFVLSAPPSGAARHEEPDADEPPVVAVLPAAGLFAAYVLTLPWLGFDVGTFLFLAAFLRLQGERRWPWLIGYSLAFAVAISEFFSYMLPYAMPMLLLGAA